MFWLFFVIFTVTPATIPPRIQILWSWTLARPSFLIDHKIRWKCRFLTHQLLIIKKRVAGYRYPAQISQVPASPARHIPLHPGISSLQLLKFSAKKFCKWHLSCRWIFPLFIDFIDHHRICHHHLASLHAKASNAPPRINASTVFLFVSFGVIRTRKSFTSLYGPFASRSSTTAMTSDYRHPLIPGHTILWIAPEARFETHISSYPA